jgi:hypothetical protein
MCGKHEGVESVEEGSGEHHESDEKDTLVAYREKQRVEGERGEGHCQFPCCGGRWKSGEEV